MQLEINERALSNGYILRINNFSGYDFAGNPGAVNYSICDYKEVVGYDIHGEFILRSDNTSEYFIAKNIMETGEMDLDTNTVSQWGASDDPVFIFVANTLGLSIQ